MNTDAKSFEIDEIKEYQATRWVSPIEAIWQIYRFPLFNIYPVVIHL